MMLTEPDCWLVMNTRSEFGVTATPYGMLPTFTVSSVSSVSAPITLRSELCTLAT